MSGTDRRTERMWGGSELTYSEAFCQARNDVAAVVTGGEAWGYDNSPLDDYQRALPALGNRALANLAETPQDRPFVAVDMMASPAALRDLFGGLPDVHKIGFAVGLTDMRTDEQKKSDEALNIHMLEHDLSRMIGWRGLEWNLAGRKVNLLLERADGGLGNVPQHPAFFSMAFNKM